MAAINNCSEILTGNTDAGGYGLDPEDALKAFKDLSLYTTAESCPMVFLPFPLSPDPLSLQTLKIKSAHQQSAGQDSKNTSMRPVSRL